MIQIKKSDCGWRNVHFFSKVNFDSFNTFFTSTLRLLSTKQDSILKVGEFMISESIPISHEDISVRMVNSNNLLQATEWSMMIAVWVRKGVFH